MSAPAGYAHVEQIVREQCPIWLTRLGLDHWDMSLTFLDASRDPDDDGDNTAAECKPQWQYLRVEIVWYLPVLVTMDDAQIDKHCLHEACHILLAAEQANMKQSEADRMELSTEYTTRALWAAWSVDRDPRLV